MEKSPMPDPVILHSYASPSTIAWVIHQKYELAVPLYRQEKECADLGVNLSRATMSNWILASYRDWLSPVLELLKKELLTQKYLHIDEIPAQAIAYINQLFDIEKKLEVLSPAGRKEQRRIQAKPVLDAFWSWAESASVGILPKSKLGEAFAYAFNQKKGLMNYLEDGNCSISNNLAENSIRPFTIGRKNWLFSGSPKGAQASAGVYTLIETAKANGLNPRKYIEYILSDIPGSAFRQYPEFLEDYLPWNPIIQKLCR